MFFGFGDFMMDYRQYFSRVASWQQIFNVFLTIYSKGQWDRFDRHVSSRCGKNPSRGN